jgi:hypothetical protein
MVTPRGEALACRARLAMIVYETVTFVKHSVEDSASG